MFSTPVAKHFPQYSTFMTFKEINHCLKDCNFQKVTALNIEYKLMSLKHFLHEYEIINGSIAIVKAIMFKRRNGPRHMPYGLPVCVIIEFKESTFAEETKWRTTLDKTNHSNYSNSQSL